MAGLREQEAAEAEAVAEADDVPVEKLFDDGKPGSSGCASACPSFKSAHSSLSSISSSTGSPPCEASSSTSTSSNVYSSWRIGGPEIEEIPSEEFFPFTPNVLRNAKIPQRASPSSSLVTGASAGSCGVVHRSSFKGKMDAFFNLFSFINGTGKATKPSLSPSSTSLNRPLPATTPVSYEDIYISACLGEHRVLVVKGFPSRQHAAHEIALLTEINYEGAVNVIGCCLEPDRRPVFAYDFFTNRNLLQAVRDASVRRHSEERAEIKVAADVATALAYLHSSLSIPVIHRDVRSSVVLLHVEDSKQPTGSPLWTPGTNEVRANLWIFGVGCSIDPEYSLLGISTCKSDVFSFGAFLVELLTGENPTLEEPPDVVLAKHYFSTLNSDLGQALAAVAFKCLSRRAEDRPAMAEVAMALSRLYDENASGIRTGRSRRTGEVNVMHSGCVASFPQPRSDNTSSEAATDSRQSSITKASDSRDHGREPKKKTKKLMTTTNVRGSFLTNILTFGTYRRLQKSNNDKLIKMGSRRSFLAKILNFDVFGQQRKKKISRMIETNKIQLQMERLNQRITSQNIDLTLKYWMSTLDLERKSRWDFRMFSVEELQEATDNFNRSQIVYEGKSTVYKGKLPYEDIFIAVKVPPFDKGKEVMLNEINIHMQLDHINVLKILGCCWDSGVLVTIYEFIEHGTLQHHINQRNLRFESRLRIANEVAEALAYMHSCHPNAIVHGDVKPSNVLLDSDFRAKVCHFGSSKSIEVVNLDLDIPLHGASSYLETKYISTVQCHDDVYKFGILLAQLLMGKEASADEELGGDTNLAAQFASYMKNCSLSKFLEKEAADVRYLDPVKVEALANIVLECLSVRADDRPIIVEVAAKLKWLRNKLCL